MTNPLLNYDEFAPYSQVKAEHIVPAVKQAIETCQANLEEILKLLEQSENDINVLNFDNTLYSFIEFDETLEKVWTPVENMLSLVGTKEIRDAANEARPLVVEFYNNYSLDPRVYKLVKRYSETAEAKSLTGEKKRHLENELKGFKLAGAELEGEDKEEFKKLNLELSELGQKFSDNATDSKYELVVEDEKELAGLPEDIRKAAKLKTEELRKEGAEILETASTFNLDYPSYVPFMKFSDNGALRKKLYQKYLSQGTSYANRGLVPNEASESLDNEPLISKIFTAKLRKSQLLGFKNYAELSLATKMAPSPEEVKIFLERLATKSKELTLREYNDLVEFQKEINYQNTENNPDKVYPWDKEYLSEKLRKARYDFDSTQLKPYFELEACTQGMFDIATRLYNIEFRVNADLDSWHKDVVPYEVISADTKEKIGTFFMDLYPRDIKRQGAWVMPLVAACTNKDGSKTLPQCTLSCNLTKPTDEQPSLLTHMELVTLFHEFGHALHHLLSRVELASLSGTDVEWDFVELPSQLCENFCWEKESLELFAKHYKTGETIPDDLLAKMLKARIFNEGLACTRQLEFGLFDLAIYMRENTDDSRRPAEIFNEITDKYGVFEQLEGTNFPCAFSHIFAGGYSAGYYSYKWAEVLEADAFSRFQKEGILNPELGQQYKESILEKGDSEAPMELFKSFMGREPSEDALLQRMGL